MNVWRFYLKPDKSVCKSKYELYAITNNHDYALSFMEMRNMDNFIMRCTDEEKEDYVKLAEDNRLYILSVHKLTTKSVNKNDIIIRNTVDVLMTEYEFQSCDSDSILSNISIDSEKSWSYAINYRVYNKKIKNSLRKLEYIPFFKLYSNPLHLEDDDDDYSAPDVRVDELSVFIKIFNRLFK